MAYNNPAPTVTKSKRSVVVTISETDAEATSEPQAIELGFKYGRILMQKCHLTSGAGSTVDPVIGTVTNPASSAKDIIISNGTAGASISNQLGAPGVPFYTATGKLYHRSVVDSGTNNAISTEYHIVQGWD